MLKIKAYWHSEMALATTEIAVM